MTIYRYRAVGDSGVIRSGQTEALNLPDLEARLAQIQLDLIEAHIRPLAVPSGWGRGPTAKDLITFCLHLVPGHARRNIAARRAQGFD